MKLDGKTALVTGTSPNICGGIAEGLADEGARIVCVDLTPQYANGCASPLSSEAGRQSDWSVT